LIDGERKSGARDAILKSIRQHLSASARHDAVHAEGKDAHNGAGSFDKDSTAQARLLQDVGRNNGASLSVLHIFREGLEAAGGHCVVVRNEQEAAHNLTRIIGGLQASPLGVRRIALSDAPIVERLMKQVALKTDEVAVTPSSAELFSYDVGITSAQGAIAETGTLVLESECERHRLVSLLPPVHIAIVEANNICLTLGEALLAVGRGGRERMSRTITFITGPSRTADIELTLAIGVHGPQELFVIVTNAPVAIS
jgi:L-lactate utilization protein LutC